MKAPLAAQCHLTLQHFQTGISLVPPEKLNALSNFLKPKPQLCMWLLYYHTDLLAQLWYLSQLGFQFNMSVNLPIKMGWLLSNSTIIAKIANYFILWDEWHTTLCCQFCADLYCWLNPLTHSNKLSCCFVVVAQTTLNGCHQIDKQYLLLSQ